MVAAEFARTAARIIDAGTFADVIDYRRRAEALRQVAKTAKAGLELQNTFAEQRLRLERCLGQMLIDGLRRGRPKNVTSEDIFGLSEIGISRNLSARAQRLAAIPIVDFEVYLATARDEQWEITTRLLLVHSDRRQAKARNRQRIVGGQIEDLIGFAAAGNRMGCIVVDPPWPILGSTLPYEAIEFYHLKALPIAELAADRCHLHLWTLPNSYHRDAYDIIEQWGFRAVSEFVWCKPQIGKGHYWRMSHEILVTAVRSKNDRFDDLGLRSWIDAPRGLHSQKPDVVREMIERASPGPRMELFARKPTPGWFCWGHEIMERLTDQQQAGN
jgi:N6-adenosine-specific RNA methylase IME4